MQRRIIPDQIATLLVAVRVVELAVAVRRDGRHGKFDTKTTLSRSCVVLNLAFPIDVADPVCETSAFAPLCLLAALTGVAVTGQHNRVVDSVLDNMLQRTIAVGVVA